MSRKLFFVCILSLGSVAHADSYGSPEQVFASVYQSYFESLMLHYEVPAGCAGDTSSQYGEKANCAVADDFNGDGNVDYVALREYIGAGSRHGEMYLDLIVLYSSVENGEPRHQVFTNMGSVSDQGVVDTFLSIQPVGDIDLPSGPMRLDRPGINLFSATGGNDDPWSYPTFYWNENAKTFFSLTKAAD